MKKPDPYHKARLSLCLWQPTPTPLRKGLPMHSLHGSQPFRDTDDLIDLRDVVIDRPEAAELLAAEAGS